MSEKKGIIVPPKEIWGKRGRKFYPGEEAPNGAKKIFSSVLEKKKGA